MEQEWKIYILLSVEYLLNMLRNRWRLALGYMTIFQRRIVAENVLSSLRTAIEFLILFREL